MTELGQTMVTIDGDGDPQRVETGADRPRHGDRTPGQWVKENLFSGPMNTILTIVFGLLGLYLAFRAATFVFSTARWEPVRSNLELFMLGLFPRAERTRVIVQLFLLSGAVGVLVGWLRQRSILTAELAGLPRPTTSVRQYVSSYWAVGLFVGFTMAVGVRTLDPWLMLVGCIVAAAAGFVATLRLAHPAAKVVVLVPLALTGGVLSLVQDLDNGAAYLIGVTACVALAAVVFAQRPSVTLSIGLLLGVASFQVLSGTAGLAWVYLTAALAPLVLDIVSSNAERVQATAGVGGALIVGGGGALLVSLQGIGIVPLAVVLAALYSLAMAVRGDAGTGVRLGALTVVGVLTWQAGRAIGVEGIDWDDWGGLQLNLITAAATTLLAFPIGLLLALGRRSSLPVLRWMCTIYIEIIRGVPLITLLFMAQLFVGFFLNGTGLPLVTRSIIVFTMFSSAYIAEIVRGGLQSVPKGQVEAGQAIGLSPAAITRLLVLPQALKAVIPAMVGQFISLFKDTSLLSFIGIPEFLGVREFVHAQAEFRGFGIAETLVFVAFGFWAVTFTMSRESQRLERRLDTGNR